MSKGHYVCDRCGTYWTSRYDPQRCINCGSLAIWRFPRPIAALEHAAHIKERRADQLEAVSTTRGTEAS